MGSRAEDGGIALCQVKCEDFETLVTVLTQDHAYRKVVEAIRRDT
jgi:hypothetical protein